MMGSNKLSSSTCGIFLMLLLASVRAATTTLFRFLRMAHSILWDSSPSSLSNALVSPFAVLPSKLSLRTLCTAHFCFHFSISDKDPHQASHLSLPIFPFLVPIFLPIMIDRRHVRNFRRVLQEAFLLEPISGKTGSKFLNSRLGLLTSVFWCEHLPLINGNLLPPGKLCMDFRNRPQILFMLRACSNQNNICIYLWTQLAHVYSSTCVETCFWLTGPPSMTDWTLHNEHLVK